MEMIFLSNFNNSILKSLKEKFVEINTDIVFDSVMTSPKREFYVSNLGDNLCEPLLGMHQDEYNRGSGNELNQKMRALHSSSALTVNLLGNNSIFFKKNSLIPAGEYSIEYEKQLRTLNVKGKPANLDAKLLCVEEKIVLFLEIKMTEWMFNSPSKLKNAYLIQDNYYNKESFDAFNKVFQSLISNVTDPGVEKKSIYERYDVFQMMKHIIGIYNEMRKNENVGLNKVRLINCVWKIDNHISLGNSVSNNYKKRYKKYISEVEDFKTKIQPLVLLFAESNIDFDIIFMSFDEFLNMVEKSEQQSAYLKRYFL